MCTQHHDLIRSLIAEIRALREEIAELEEALDYAEERVERAVTRQRQTAREYQAALQAEYDRQAAREWERERTLADLERAQRWGDTSEVERLTRRLYAL